MSAAAVILPEDHKIIGLDDSKKYPAKRLQLREDIMNMLIRHRYCQCGEIDQHNIYNATKTLCSGL